MTSQRSGRRGRSTGARAVIFHCRPSLLNFVIADTQAFLGAVIPGRDEMYETEASPQMLALAREHGGFLLIVTQAADPARLDADALTCALASPMTVTGWARLGHDSGLT
jgi:hypothetical protein